MLNYFYVAIGSALGGMARFWVSGSVANRYVTVFPWGTLLVNITGSFIIGFFATATGTQGRWLVGPRGRNFFMSGVCGGYTTFSSFSLQTLNLIQDGEWLYATGNILLSVVCCMAGVWMGHALAQFINPTKGI